VSYRVSFRINPCVERAYACQARACTGPEGFIHSEESVRLREGGDDQSVSDTDVCAMRPPRLIMTLAHDARVGRKRRRGREGGRKGGRERVCRDREGPREEIGQVVRFNLRSINGAVLSVSA